MKTNVVLYAILSVFFLAFSIIYPVWVSSVKGELEWVGTIALPFTLAMYLLLGGFLYLNLRRKSGGVLPEDRNDADIDDGDSEMGYYAPWSWWPFFAGAVGGVLMLGMSVGIWVALFGLGAVIITFLGWFYEPVRGNFRR